MISVNEETRQAIFAAAAVLASVPVMVIFLLLQRYIQGGLVAGGVKG
ncbi:MAG: hypothetical protein K2O91_22150 [Lachnospiraceae bacterium]|nr:hypothetical protein [Lachnospiraceae bacterium]